MRGLGQHAKVIARIAFTRFIPNAAVVAKIVPFLTVPLGHATLSMVPVQAPAPAIANAVSASVHWKASFSTAVKLCLDFLRLAKVLAFRMNSVLVKTVRLTVRTWTFTPPPEFVNATMATQMVFVARLHRLTVLPSGRRAMRTVLIRHTQSSRIVREPGSRALRLMEIAHHVLLVRAPVQDSVKMHTVQMPVGFLATGSGTESGCSLASLLAKVLRTMLVIFGTLKSLLSAWTPTTTLSCMDTTVPRASQSALDCQVAAHLVQSVLVAVWGRQRNAPSFVELSPATDGENRQQLTVPTQMVYFCLN